jgi:hypothetical protein
MTSPAWKIAVGVTLYFLLTLALYGLLHIVGGGPIPLWFSIAKVFSEAATYVVPGFVVGWLSRERGLVRGAVAGAIGALVSTTVILYHWSLPPAGGLVGALSAEVLAHWALIVVLAALAASFTNAIGGIAGAAVRQRVAHDVAP